MLHDEAAEAVDQRGQRWIQYYRSKRRGVAVWRLCGWLTNTLLLRDWKNTTSSEYSAYSALACSSFVFTKRNKRSRKSELTKGYKAVTDTAPLPPQRLVSDRALSGLKGMLQFGVAHLFSHKNLYQAEIFFFPAH